ncbi:MAG: SRPBCC family protein [Candidatus Tumulicola sp.]
MDGSIRLPEKKLGRIVARLSQVVRRGFSRQAYALNGSRSKGDKSGEVRKEDPCMSTLKESIDVNCPAHYLIHHAERYLTVYRRDQTPGTFSLVVDMSKVGLPGKVKARHDVQMRYKISEEADHREVIALTWDPDDRFVPKFAGVLSGERLEGGGSRLTLAGEYDVPLGRLGIAFDVILGRRIGAETANALLQDMKNFIESDYRMALSTTLASSPKE